jgi:hypothetical protein
MMTTNHVLTGTLIGLTIHTPALALPIAFVSHFILDVLPHYGDSDHIGKKFKMVLSLDILVASLVLIAMGIFRPMYWQLGVLCAVIAASPDLVWLPMWLHELKHESPGRMGIFSRFHKKIQWAETAKNYPFEFIWAGLCVLVLVKGW